MTRRKGLSLKRLLEMLIEEGATEEEADEALEHFVRMRERRDEDRPRALARVGGQDIEPTHTPTLGPGQRPVDYGDETPQEAKRRWMRQEAEDPGGIFAGGMSAGGIFGGGPIATETYDPAAVRRTVDAQVAVRGAEVQERTLQVLERVLDRLEGTSAGSEPQIASSMGRSKQLGRKPK